MTYFKRLRRNLHIAKVVSFLTSLLFYMPIWYTFETQFAPAEVLAIVYAVTHMVSVFLEIPTGALADLLGRKRTVFLGLLFQGFGWVIVSQAVNVSYIWIGYAIAEIGATLVSGAETALYYDSLKELGEEKQYTRFSAANSIIFRIGITLATFLGGYLFVFSKNLPYIGVGISLFIAALVTLFTVEPHIDSEKFTLKNYVFQTKQGLRELLKNSYIRTLSLYYISVGGLTWYFIYFLYLVVLQEKGFSTIQLGWITSAIHVCIGIGLYFLVWKFKFPKNTALLFFPIVMLVSFLFAPFVTKYMLIILVFLGYLTGVSRWPILDQYVNAEFDSKHRATAISTLSMAVSIMYTLISIIVGPILSTFGGSGVMFTLGIFTLITTVPAALALLKNHQEKY